MTKNGRSFLWKRLFFVAFFDYHNHFIVAAPTKEMLYSFRFYDIIHTSRRKRRPFAPKMKGFRQK